MADILGKCLQIKDVEVWQVGRSDNTPYPLKDVSSSWAFREEGRWVATVTDPKVSQKQRSDEGEGKAKLPQLKPPSKEEWPTILDQ